MQTVFIHRTDEEERKPAGRLGRPISSFYNQINSYVTTNLGSEIASYFAEPVQHERDGGIDWFTECDDTPLRLSEMTAGERHDILIILQDWRTKLATLSRRSAEDKSEIHEVLDAVLNEPSVTDVFVSNGKPVVVNWGYLPSNDFIPIGYPGANRTETPEHTQPAHDRVQASPTPRQRIQISALSACAIAAVIMAASAGIFRLVAFPDERSAIAGIEEEGLDTAALSRQQALNGRVRTEIDEMQVTYTNLLLACAGACLAANPAPIPLPTSPSPAQPLQPKPAEPLPSPQPGEELEPLEIPEKAAREKDTSFLKGVWRSIQNELFIGDEDNKEPIIVEYHINADGSGYRQINSTTGNICKGTIKASFTSDGSVLIRDLEPARCDNGNGIAEYTVTCTTKAKAKAECTMTDNDPDPTTKRDPITVQMRRLK